MRNLKIYTFFLFLFAAFAAGAQVTTSTLTGTVRDQQNQPLVGATITATNTATGVVYQAATNKAGGYNIFNMVPGGPYRIDISYTGFDAQSRGDVLLSLGENAAQDFSLVPRSTALTEVVVTGTRANNRLGSETNIGRDKIANLPTVGRNLSDLLRFTPQAKITANGGIAIAGQNNRYNTFMIDGAVNNDVFGLSESGTNGGRAGAPPISLDAIDQISVQVSPFDVSLGNFTGGGINAITRSGSNKFNGSAYYVFRNQDLSGKSPVPVRVDGKETRPKLADFQNKTFGFRVGGPIIQNKLFFFINAEKQDDSRPQPFNTSDYRGNYLKNDSLNTLLNFLKTSYNYEPGDYVNNPDNIKGTRIATRFDYNISPKHQLMASYRYTKLERLNPTRSASNINFTGGGEFFPSTQNSGTVELNSRFSNRINNKLRVSYTNVVDDRAVVGTPFPAVTIRDINGAQINFGSEISSAANLLKQDILNLYDTYKLTLGKNVLTAGFDIDVNKTYNLFINRNYGFYEYASIGAFMANSAPIRYRRGYSLVSTKSGDESEGVAAEFNTHRLGFFVGDEVKLTPNFTLTAGIRADRTVFDDNPVEDPFFRDTAAAIIGQYYDLKGAQTGRMYHPGWQWSPRVGFRATVPDENITVRGGIGLFAGRVPLVWPGGVFQNTGISTGAIDIRNRGDVPISFPNGDPVSFRPDVNNQYTGADFGFTGLRTFPQGELNIIAKNFKMPQVLRTSLGFDKRIASGWTFTLEAIFTKNIEEVDWQNVIFDPTQVRQTTGPDVRQVYDPTVDVNTLKIPLRPYLPAAQRNPYTSIILIKNNEDRKGYSYNFTAVIDKAFRQNWAFNASYTYGNSVVKNEATSSVNSSNWNNMEAVNGRNYIGLTNSDFDLGHRLYSYVSKKFNYARNKLSTTITVDYTGQSGSPFSYTMTGNINGDGNNFNDLMYVPTKEELQQMVFVDNKVGSGENAVTYSPNQQRAYFEEHISKDSYLSSRRGQHAERNGARLPFVHLFTAKVQQDFNIKLGSNTYAIQVIYDVFNLGNLVNKNWGKQYFANFDQVQILQFAGYQTGTVTPTYKFTPITSGRPYSVSDGVTTYNSSRWSSQLTFRVTL
jgi:outer membrane receptor for ferrienterochelin and colicin